jgi:GNAT superfamily N-acetyltransferase
MIKKEKIIISKITVDDIPSMVAARINYLTEMQGKRSDIYLHELTQNLHLYFIQAISEGSFFALQAEYEEKIVSYGGMILKKIPGDLNQSSYLEGEILNMYTLPEFRRYGISSQILKQLIIEARMTGISKLALHCSKAGELLYRKFGFSDPVYPYLELVID